MKISRIVEGKTIELELTNEEMENAYRERDEYYHKEDIQSRYRVEDEAIPAIAEAWMDRLGDHDSYWDIYWSTLEQIAKEHGLEELDYE